MGTDVKGACEDTTGMEEFVSEAEAVYRNRQIFFSKYDKTVKMTAYQRCMGMDFFFFFFCQYLICRCFSTCFFSYGFTNQKQRFSVKILVLYPPLSLWCIITYHKLIGPLPSFNLG